MNKRWSFSALETYEQCPAKYHYRYTLKLPQPPQDPNGPLARGNRLHAELENYIMKDEPLHKRFDPFKAYIDAIKATPGVQCEQLIGLDANWKHMPDPDADGVWLRYKLDVKIPCENPEEIRVVDFKSGRVYAGKHFDQASLYALGMFAEHPEVKRVQTEFVYLDQRSMTEHVITADAAPVLRENFAKRVVIMHEDKLHRAIPSRLCAWCDYSTTKGGPCPNTGK